MNYQKLTSRNIQKPNQKLFRPMPLPGAAMVTLKSNGPHECSKKSATLICNLLQLNLKLFQDLFRYKHAFNSFQADLNTHLTTIANQQQQLIDSNNDSTKSSTKMLNSLMDDNKVINENDLLKTKQKISDMICEKFLQTCSDLTQPGLIDDGDYESNIYSILAIVDNFNNNHFLEDDDDPSKLADDGQNDSELKSLSNQIGQFLNKLNRNEKFRIKLLEQLFQKLVNEESNQDRLRKLNQQKKLYRNIPNYNNLIDSSNSKVNSKPNVSFENQMFYLNQNDDNSFEELKQDDKNSGFIDKDPLDNDDSNEIQEIPHSGQQKQQLSVESVNIHLANYKCKFCNESFSQAALLIQHQRNKHQAFGCGRCMKTFRNEYVLRIHLRINSCQQISDQAILSSQPERKHKCKWPGCGKTFTRTSYLTNHMMAHSDERNFVCHWPGCPKRYKTKAHLLNHLTIHGNSETKQPERENAEEEETFHTNYVQANHKCQWQTCSESFQDESQLFEHYQRVHDENNTSKALIASNQPTQKVNTIPSNQSSILATPTPTPKLTPRQQQLMLAATKLQQEQGVQQNAIQTIKPSNDLQFQCEFCGTSFTKKSSLSNHVKSHSGQYSCSWDGCLFRTHLASRLSRHMLSHLMSYDVAINYDNNNNNNNNNVDDLDQQNTDNNDGNQPQELFTCKLCGKTFRKRSSIINHVRSHSGQYSCKWPGCYFASQSKVLFRKHVQQANHQMQSNDDQEDDDDNDDSSQQQYNSGVHIENYHNSTGNSILASVLEGKITSSTSRQFSSQQPQTMQIKNQTPNETESMSNFKIKQEEEEIKMFVEKKNSFNNKEFLPISQATNTSSLNHQNGISSSKLSKDTNSIDTSSRKTIRIFRCGFPDCSYQTHKRPLFRMHMLKHSEVRKHRCRLCGKSFKAKSTLNRHLFRHRQAAQLKQLGQQVQETHINNNSEASDEGDWSEDVTDMDGVGEILLNIPEGQIGSMDEENSDSSSRMNNSFEIRQEYQDSGQAIFQTQVSLSNHRLSQLPQKYHCEHVDCSFETYRFTNLERHLRESHGSLSKVESYEKSSSSSILQSHNGKYKCNYNNDCKKIFPTKQTLDEHLINHKNKVLNLNLAGHEQNLTIENEEHFDDDEDDNDEVEYADELNDVNPKIRHQQDLTIHKRSNGKLHKCQWPGCTYTSSRVWNLQRHFDGHQQKSVYQTKQTTVEENDIEAESNNRIEVFDDDSVIISEEGSENGFLNITNLNSILQQSIVKNCFKNK